MTFRGRILLACVVAALVPLGLFAFGARREVRERLRAQFDERVASAGAAIRQDLDRHGASLDVRLAALARRMADEPQVRAALLEHTDRRALLDYAADVMSSLELDHLLVLDSLGTVLSSGHFRNEYDRRLDALPALLAADAPVLLETRRADGPLLALVRAHPFDAIGRAFVLVGGVEVDTAFMRGLARGAGGALGVSLVHPGGPLAAGAQTAARGAVEEITVAYVNDAGGAPQPGEARWVVVHSLAGLHAVQRRLDLWLLAAVTAAVLLALVIARALAARVNRPLEELAKRSLRVNLDRPDVTFWTRRPDEIGTLSRTLDTMVRRLRAGANELRAAERRATVGDLARQVNHDLRNGLLPIRNVIRHLTEVARDSPEELAGTFTERAATLQGGIGYLESLATNYARLSPHAERQACDINAVVSAVADHAAGADAADVHVVLDAAAPRVLADPVALRRVVENLIVNAEESLGAAGGTVTVTTAATAAAGDRIVTLTVADTGAGIETADVDRIFDDFYTTKERGTGLGLSIVRRLISDMGGRIRVESTPGRGTIFSVELPEAP